jgi:hypothetical protein
MASVLAFLASIDRGHIRLGDSGCGCSEKVNTHKEERSLEDEGEESLVARHSGGRWQKEVRGMAVELRLGTSLFLCFCLYFLYLLFSLRE